VPVNYKGLVFEEPQPLSYMRLLEAPLGLLMNFHEIRLIDGIHRIILPRAGDRGLEPTANKESAGR
jgi:hypothetical protein